VNNEIQMVEKFMEQFGQMVRYQPSTKMSPKDRSLRAHLLIEHAQKVCSRLGVTVSTYIGPEIRVDSIDPAKLLDELVDLLYVTIGTACTAGLQRGLEPGFKEVQRSNLSKMLPDGTVIRDELGKIVKGPDFKRANFDKIISTL
jgi:hypothetical protein